MQVPHLRLIEQLQADHPRRTIAVLIPEVVKRRWWQHLLHTHRAHRLRSALLSYGGSGLVVMNAPWYLDEPRIDEALTREELDDPADAEPARRASESLPAGHAQRGERPPRKPRS
jgi:hypothetical protein